MSPHPPRRSALRWLGVALAAAGLALGAGASLAQDLGPTVDVVEVDGLVERALAGHLERVLDRAEADGAEVVVVALSSRGSLGDSGLRLAERIAASTVPVAVWVGPPGASAVGGAEALVEAAHVFATAPRTEVATDRAPAFEVASLPSALVELDGLEVAGRALDIDPSLANVRFHTQGLVSRVLHAAADPLLAYVLLLGGVLCLAFEVFQPGFGVAGISGVPLALLGLYGFAVLPTRWWALALALAGVVLLAVELALARLGWMTALGAAALAAGSWLLLPEPLRLAWWLVALVTLAAAGFFVLVMTTVLRAQGNQALAGAESVIGRTAVVRSMLNPEGHVFVAGSLWRARAPDEAGRVKTGTRVRVVGLNDRLTLDVELADEDEPSVV